MSEHDFCRSLLKMVRSEARAAKVKVPLGLTACGPTGKQYFIESRHRDSSPREYAKGCCSWSAKAAWISGLLNRLSGEREEREERELADGK